MERKVFLVSAFALVVLALVMGACKQPATPAVLATEMSAVSASAGTDDGAVTLPEADVTKIDMCAYIQREDLKSVIVRDGVTKIDKWAFYNCINLTSVVIPDSVTEIDEGAFKDCSSLTSITIGAGVEIGRDVFIDSQFYLDYINANGKAGVYTWNESSGHWEKQ
jgi:hypothetical protein